ncbi:putative bifunctional diguanylate cyclase/phosphodiesterase [Paenibacillus kyungheensis]
MEHMDIHYNTEIVVLSLIISIFASYLALNLANKVSQSRGTHKIIWLSSGSFVMGGGIWAMHFVGMLAFHTGVNIRYDVGTTFLSAFASITASLIAFYVTLDSVMRLWKIAVGGAAMGIGIVTMHYTGMAAMQMDADITYNPFYLMLSVLVALGASYAALFLFRRFRSRPNFSLWKLYSSIVMGFAISGMHYTGMAAAQFHYTHTASTDESMKGQLFLITGVAVVTFLILAISWAAIFVERHILERMAYSDPLTGLPNRHGLQRYFEKEFKLQKEGAVLFLDLDRFKSINDTLGHDIGDELLVQVAQRLKVCMVDQGIVFRLGGDEFLIATSKGITQDIEQLAEHILDVVKKPYQLGGIELFITVSIGIALVPQHGYERSFLMRAADTAMYVSKNSGKNKYSIFSEDMNRRQIRRMELENDLRRAFESNQLFIVYQPKWDSMHNRLTGMEALLRWNHPELGMVSPAEFIPVAEETGLIMPITNWMLEETCQQNLIWQKQHHIYVPISVNMSARMFECPGFANRVEQIIAETGIEARYLELEITESIAMDGIEGTVEQLQYIQQLGVKIALDDFGTGYSSLGILDELPIDILKIDQIFIRKSDIASKQAIISTIVAIADNLNLDLVAEGVETQAQVEFLQSKGCYVIQGYYYGRPMTISQMDQWIQSIDKKMSLAE